MNGITKDTIVIDQNSSVGKAITVFRDGRTEYQLPNYKEVSSKLSGKIPSLGLISVGTTVIDSNNSVGTAIHVFADGRIQYQLQNYKEVSRSLKAKIDQFDGIKSGDIVIDSNNSIGKLIHAFEDGRFYYQLPNYKEVSKNLSPRIDELDGFKAGIVVIDRNDGVGTIEHVFRDGRISYQLPNYREVSSRLSKESESHPLYNKDTVYATTQYAVGTPIHFFENKKVQLKTVDGQTAVSSELFTSVEELNGYRVDQPIVDSERRESKIKAVFANGTLHYEVKDEESGELKDITAKLYGYFTEKDPKKLEALRKSEEDSWLIGLAVSFSPKDSWHALIYRASTGLAVSLSELPKIKASLHARLKKDKNLIENKDLRKKVMEYLSN